MGGRGRLYKQRETLVMDWWWVLLAVAALAAVVGWLWWRPRAKALAFVPGVARTPGKVYSPQNVGNDASARPWERSTTFDMNLSPGAATAAVSRAHEPGWGVPEGFDQTGFLDVSKTNFIKLQAAWDMADIPSLKAMMTDGMLSQIQTQLLERESHTGAAQNCTEVVMLEAQLLGIEEFALEYLASVEFSGLIREDPSAGPSPFREVWSITRTKAGAGGWLVAGVQALQ